MTNRDHWERVYREKSAAEVSWYQPTPALSLELVAHARSGSSDGLVDVGGGASTLVDGLLDLGFDDLTVVDVASSAFERSRARLGARAGLVAWIVADVTAWQPPRRYGIWHDRAVFHFLTEPAARARYRATLEAALLPGGSAIVATFAPDGPEKCSGLPVERYSIDRLAQELAPILELVEAREERHATPWGASQSFVYGRFRRRA